MKKYYPYTEIFVENVEEANTFLSTFSCVEEVDESSWEIAIIYSNKDIRIRHYFGDRDRHFNTVIGTVNSSFVEYGLWEWLVALEKKWPKKITDNLIESPEGLIELINNSAACLEENIGLILSANKSVFNQMNIARKKVLEGWD